MPTKLGQNFLVNKKIIDRIIKEADLKSDDLALEIGAGKGILTEELAKFAGKVVAVEIDKQLVGLLRNKLRNKKNVEIIEGDILKFQISRLPKTGIGGQANDKFQIKSHIPNPKKQELDSTNYKLQTINYKVIANLPYYITSPVIRKFLESDNPPSEMILMVQKEVAERICEKPGKMSILSISVQYYAHPEILFYVEKGNFDPVPEVDSAVIKISRNKTQKTRDREFDKNFFRVVKAGFCAKRKMLANNLANSFHLEKKEVEEKLKKVEIKLTARAQELSVESWAKLASEF